VVSLIAMICRARSFRKWKVSQSEVKVDDEGEFVFLNSYLFHHI
jgi:hypothetical protein